MLLACGVVTLHWPALIIARVLFILFIVAMSSSSTALAGRIKDFQSELRLDSDGLLSVREQITIDFERSIRNGFYRHIPLKPFSVGRKGELDVRLIEITNESGFPVAHQLSRQGDDLSIRIGEDSKLMCGVRLFHIVYLVRDAVKASETRQAPGGDWHGEGSGDERRAVAQTQGAQAPERAEGNQTELAWHVTGRDWPYPIDSAQCRFFPPPGTVIDRIDASCSAGRRIGKAGERAGKCDIEMKEKEVIYRARSLLPGEELNVVARLPADTIAPHSVLEDLSWFWQDWCALFAVPLFTSVALLVYWLAFGRDALSGPEILPGLNPPEGLTPAEVGTLIDERCDVPDVLSTLIDLCARGYIKIREIKYSGILMMSNRDYEFTRMSPSGHLPALKLHETLFMDAMFGVVSETAHLSHLQGVFYPYIANIERAIWSSLLATRLFARDPDQDRRVFHWLAGLMFLGGILAAVFLGHEARAAAVGTIFGAMVVALWSNAMPARTSKGSRSLNQCRAFQRFLRRPDTKKVEAMVAEDPSVFGRYLSYAIVLGATDQWAGAFKGLLGAAPAWYVPFGEGSGGNWRVGCGEAAVTHGAEVTGTHGVGASGSDRGDGQEGLPFDAEAFICQLGSAMHVIQAALYMPPGRGIKPAHADSEDAWSQGVDGVIRSGFRRRR